MSKIMISTTCREGTTLGSRIRQYLFPDTFFEKGSTLFATMRAAFSLPWIRQYLPKTRDARLHCTRLLSIEVSSRLLKEDHGRNKKEETAERVCSNRPLDGVPLTWMPD